MKSHRHFHPKRILAVAIAATLAGALPSAQADERADLEQLRATTLNLINALVESGVLPRDKADKLVSDAVAKAKESAAQASATQTAVVQTGAVQTPPPAPELGKDGKKIVRVVYVSEAMKQELREQVRNEVLAQAKTERWGDPGAMPDWLGRFQFDGDMRLRYEASKLDKNNAAPGYANFANGNLTRAADIAGSAGAGGSPNFNTQDNRDRWRVRARLGVNAKVSDMVSAGLKISTGNTTDRVSTNQTLGQNFNKYTLVLDRGFIQLKPTDWLSLSGGRIANPFFSTDLVWADDLNFEGVNAALKLHPSPELTTFANAGWYPLRENNPLQTKSRDLLGAQAGLDWQFSSTGSLKMAGALYDYRHIRGQQETDAAFTGGIPDYGTRYEYPSGLRQRGNTLFVLNAPSDTTSPTYWGLASGFRELDLTATLDLAQFDPVHVMLTGDFVKNLAFDRNSMSARTGTPMTDGVGQGYMARIQVGYPNTVRRGDWNVSLAYRHLGSDAVLDAFTNSDFGLGGTNNVGYILGLNYGIDTNSWLSARWLSSNVLDPMAPYVRGATATNTKFAVDLLQLDLNARF